MSRRPSAFTLVELLVVLAVLAVLASVGMSTVAIVRDSALGTQCRGNMAQIGQALSAYQSDWRDRWPAPYDRDSGVYWNTNIWNEMGLGDFASTLAKSPQMVTQGPTACPSLTTFNTKQAQMRGYGMSLVLPPNYSRTPSDPGSYQHPIPSRIRLPASTPVLGDSRGLYRPDTGDWHLGALDAFAVNNLIGYVHRRHGNLLFADLHVEALAPTAAATAVSRPLAPCAGAYGNGVSY
jgi:prepilin-type N-terminal cleavage/methylation domain-containing protein/prepilin-type processing-associated H-X9-DG protein